MNPSQNTASQAYINTHISNWIGKTTKSPRDLSCAGHLISYSHLVFSTSYYTYDADVLCLTYYNP